MKISASTRTSLPVIGSMALFLTACSSMPSSISLPALADTQAKAEGTVIWRDLATTAPDKVKPFYTNVFGWEYQEVNSDYSLITYQGNYIAGLATMPSNSTTNYWLPVLSSADLDATVAKSEAAGGTTLIEKTELKGRGEIAVLQDPQGAVFSVLDTVSGDPAPLPKASGNWIWQEVWSQDIAQSQSFYQQLGAYKQETQTIGENDYAYLSVNDTPAVGFVKNANQDIPTAWVNYIKVDDVNATVAKVTANGGIVLMAPNEAVRNGTVAVVRDPAGAGFVVQEIKK